jgi:hypothetical protein
MQLQPATKKRKLDDFGGVLETKEETTGGGGDEEEVRKKMDDVVRDLIGILCDKRDPGVAVYPAAGDCVYHITIKDVSREFDPLLIQERLLTKNKMILNSNQTRITFGQSGFTAVLLLVVMPIETYATNCPKPTLQAVTETNDQKQQQQQQKTTTIIDPALLVLRSLEEYAHSYLGNKTPVGITTTIYYPKDRSGLFAPALDFIKGPELQELSKDAVVAPRFSKRDDLFVLEIKGWSSASMIHFWTLRALFPFHVEYLLACPKQETVRVYVRHALLPDKDKAVHSPLLLML